MIDALIRESPAGLNHPVRSADPHGQAQNAARRLCVRFLCSVPSCVSGAFPTAPPHTQ